MAKNRKPIRDSSSPNPPNPPTTITFSDQVGIGFTIGLATWSMNATNFARNQFAEGWTNYPVGLTNGMQVYWKNSFEPITDSLCGFIGTIQGPSDGINRIQIAIRGTQTAAELVSDIDYSQIPYPSASIPGNVHKGFYGVYTNPLLEHPSLQNQLITALTNTYLSSTQTNRVYVTGHSLGAAVATLIAADLAVSFPGLEVICYTFASPRVGDPTFADNLDSYIMSSPSLFINQRVFNTDDVVPNLPPVISGKQPLLYQHTNSYFGSFIQGGATNFSGGFSFSANLGTIELNHQICTYYSGVYNGTQSCPPNPSSGKRMGSSRKKPIKKKKK